MCSSISCRLEVVASPPYVVDVVVSEVERSEGGGGRDQAQVGDRVVGQVQVLLKIKIFEWLGVQTRVAEVARGHGGPPPKSLNSGEHFKPEHTLFCRKLRFVAIYALF